MRTKSSILNSLTGFVASFISIIIGFICQKIFLSILNAEYLGVNGLFSNILSLLSITELGLGQTIIYHLYKPVAEKDIERIKTLLNVYKKSYLIISLIIFILGLTLIPFLNFFIGENNLDLNFEIVYILFLIQTVSSYLLTYKRSLLYANQKSYTINIVHVFYSIISNAFQLVILFLTKNYYIYLVIKIFFQILENIVINIFCNKFYPYIKEKSVRKLDKETEKDILERVKAQLFHKIGGSIVLGTDNILISKFINVYTVGLYANYSIIISSVKSMFGNIVGSLSASVGNLLIEKNYAKNYDIYKKIRFINFWIATFCSISILVIMESFIILWLGPEYLLDNSVLLILCLVLYQSMTRGANDTFLSGAGICIETKYVPLIESALNLIFSILLLQFFGLAGIFMGTFISSLPLWCYSYPVFVYKKLLHRNYFNYFIETIGYLFLFIIISILTYFISTIIPINDIFIKLIVNMLICVIIPNFILIIIFHKSDNYIYFKELIIKMIKKYYFKLFKKAKNG